MNPTIGRIVVYRPTAQEQLKVVGQGCTPQKELPAIIVAVDKKEVNLRVLLDGPEAMYRPGISEGKKEGEWSWPVIEKEK